MVADQHSTSNKMNQFLLLTLFSLLALYATGSRAESVTYPGIGTFTDKDFYDIKYRPFVFLPQSPEHIDPVFSLYTPKNPQGDQQLVYNDPSTITASNFNASLRTKVVVHGFIDNRDFGAWMNEIRDEFLKHEPLNIILVDWSKGNFFPYGQATANTRVVGPMIGILIENICKVKNITADSFHLLGHSLGSHIVGYAGKFLNGKIGHITGLDPAGPYYEGMPPEARLWHTDAQFVDAIHTDATHLIPEFGFGMYETCAHIDIFPNGGRSQPGCDQERITSIVIKGLLEGARRLVACNHQRAVDFYIQSINNHKGTPKAYMCDDYNHFQSGKCIDCDQDGSKCTILGPMAENYKKTIKDLRIPEGKRFFLATSDAKPFFQYQYIVNIKMSPKSKNHIDQHGKIALQFVDSHGNVEMFDFNTKDELFHADHSYAKAFVFETDPAEVSQVDLEWTHNGLLGLIFKATLYVESIEIISLSTKGDIKSSSEFHFQNPNPSQGVVNNRHVRFSLTK